MSLEQLIQFHTEDIDFHLEKENSFLLWIKKCIEEEGQEHGNINYIFCSDDYLHALNVEYLSHDTLTDIITFNYNTEEQIAGDIFISIDRVTENAKELKVSMEDELSRVMIHGVLHLLGYDDKGAENQATMRAKEDFCLTLRPSK